jgi:pyruvate kinase
MDASFHSSSGAEACRSLLQQLESLCAEMEVQAEVHAEQLAGLPEDVRPSAENLLQYLILRSRDLRTQQEQLARLGLSSLGRLEAHVLPTVEAVVHNLHMLLGERPDNPDIETLYAACSVGADRLLRNTVALLGTHPGRRRVYIMVTMPSEAATDYFLIHNLLDSGMDCMRINCAHDDPQTWNRMIRNLRYAERITGRNCRVLMDLSGPKLRTGAMKQIPGVLKVRPMRARMGEVMRPARIWLTGHPADCEQPVAADACLAVNSEWLARVRPGSRIRFQDARGSKRAWRIRDVSEDGCWAEARKTAYIMNGVEFRLFETKDGEPTPWVVENLPRQDSQIVLRNGDTVLLECSDSPGRPALLDEDGALLNPGVVSLPIPELYRDCCPGENVFFDDGRIGGMIESVEPGVLRVRITHTRNPVEKLGSDKGINFPDSRLDLPALSGKDLEDMDFAARHADVVGLSFTNGPDDVRRLREELCARGGEHVAVIVKIETKRGFANLPDILLEAMKFPACGVMIARGDLAVETGFERLAEVQEEILWVCEAAHVPVIWATQVLEALTKKGHATRAEITDAAMGQAAECVMLNKGPHISRAVRVLDDILKRMQGHRAKKRSMLRRLELAALYQTSERNGGS